MSYARVFNLFFKKLHQYRISSIPLTNINSILLNNDYFYNYSSYSNFMNDINEFYYDPENKLKLLEYLDTNSNMSKLIEWFIYLQRDYNDLEIVRLKILCSAANSLDDEEEDIENENDNEDIENNNDNNNDNEDIDNEDNEDIDNEDIENEDIENEDNDNEDIDNEDNEDIEIEDIENNNDNNNDNEDIDNEYIENEDNEDIDNKDIEEEEIAIEDENEDIENDNEAIEDEENEEEEKEIKIQPCFISKFINKLIGKISKAEEPELNKEVEDEEDEEPESKEEEEETNEINNDAMKKILDSVKVISIDNSKLRITTTYRKLSFLKMVIEFGFYDTILENKETFLNEMNYKSN